MYAEQPGRHEVEKDTNRSLQGGQVNSCMQLSPNTSISLLIQASIQELVVCTTMDVGKMTTFILRYPPFISYLSDLRAIFFG